MSDNATIARRDRDPAAFISSIWRGEFEPKAQQENLRGVGFKLFLNHNAEALRYIINSDARIVFLRRRNALARYSSFKIAGASGEWKSTEKTPKQKLTVNFYPAEFRAYVQNFLSLESMFAMVMNRWNRNYFDAWYEDISSRSEVWDQMVRHLGYEPEEFGQTALVKQNTSDVLARFSNPDEVTQFMVDIDRRDWLTE